MAKPLLPLLAVLLLTYSVGALSFPPCPHCGSTPVPYPLSTAANCGDQSYKIRCAAGGTLMFDSSNNTYPITSISPSIQRLTIAPSPILPNACFAADFPFNGLQLNRSGPFNVSSSNTILYFNCSEAVLKSHLNCTKDSLCYTYLNNATCSACRNAPCCELHSSGVAQRIRMREGGCHAYTSFVHLDPALPVARWPQPAVELRWVLPPQPTCGGQADCGSGSTCGPDPNSNGGVNRCFCNSGLRWDPVNGVCAQGK